MAVKKSELYSSLWALCDNLRGGMDASQYKDYVLVMLFIKYISDKWAGQKYAPITIPEGSSFKDMVALKGKTDIGDQINKKIIAPIAEANNLTDMPDFDDVGKLGEGKEMVDRLDGLIAVFQKPELDFSKNRSDGDDILGDAYEYLMRNFATESGKSKGQFYTPAEVSRTMAKIIGIGKAETSSDTTVYDPTCGSGSLLLRVGAEATTKVSLYGQEKEGATSGLARMNMIIHDYPTGEIKQGNTLTKPMFKENDTLKQFDYVVANPPFSDKSWSTGLKLPKDEPFNRFEGFGVPPEKNGDFAYLLHIVKSLKRNGKGAVILPHGVLFRGNAEAVIRENLVKRGYIKAIIGFPANLFYGTGIPACIILIDKENAHSRKGIFFIDAGKGFVKDGNKNRLREQDIRTITDVFAAELPIAGYSRMVPVSEVAENDYNLNIPRYIDNQETQDIQDILAHLLGGIPKADVDALQNYWQVFPSLRKALFADLREGYVQLLPEKSALNDTIYSHPEFIAFTENMETLFSAWQTETTAFLKNLTAGCKPKELIEVLADSLLGQYENKPLVDKYNVYQHLLAYWNETMQDDLYIIAADGWKAATYRIQVENKQKKMVDKGWACDLLPKELVTNRFLQAKKEEIAAQLTELEEEHDTEDGFFNELDKVNKANVIKRIKELRGEKDVAEEVAVLKAYLDLVNEQTATNKAVKVAETKLDDLLYAKYPELTEDEIKTLAVDDKWMATINAALKGEIDNISQRLTNRINELGERYETPLPEIDHKATQLEERVMSHLKTMGYA
jgi:type I restriction enzyme M protein